MFRNSLYCVTSLILLASSFGCRMCGSTYDYCGPTFSGNECEGPCDPMFRANSILSNSALAMNQPVLEGDAYGYTDQKSGNTLIPIRRNTQDSPTPAGGSWRRIAVPDSAPNGIDMEHDGGNDGETNTGNGGNDFMPSEPESNRWMAPPPETLTPETLPPLPFSVQPSRPMTMRQRPYMMDPSSGEELGLTLERLQNEDPSIMGFEIVGVEDVAEDRADDRADPDGRSSPFQTAPLTSSR